MTLMPDKCVVDPALQQAPLRVYRAYAVSALEDPAPKRIRFEGWENCRQRGRWWARDDVVTLSGREVDDAVR